jgi:hypothetical protein
MIFPAYFSINMRDYFISSDTGGDIAPFLRSLRTTLASPDIFRHRPAISGATPAPARLYETLGELPPFSADTVLDIDLVLHRGAPDGEPSASVRQCMKE